MNGQEESVHPRVENLDREKAFSEYLDRRSAEVGYNRPYSEMAAMSESDLNDYCKGQLHVFEQLCVGRAQAGRVAIHFPSASNGKYEERFLSLVDRDEWIRLMHVEAYISDRLQDLLPRSFMLGRIPVHTFGYSAGLAEHTDDEKEIFTFVWERLGSLWHAADHEYMERGKEQPDSSDIAELLRPDSQNTVRKVMDLHFETIQDGGAYIVDAYGLKGFPPSTLDVMQRLLGKSGVGVEQMLAAWGYSLELLPEDVPQGSPRFAVIKRSQRLQNTR